MPKQPPPPRAVRSLISLGGGRHAQINSKGRHARDCAPWPALLSNGGNHVSQAEIGLIGLGVMG
ncbi:NADP-dependent phosphogluconate dehydrogenase, partial [Sinorhizobium meliloti]